MRAIFTPKQKLWVQIIIVLLITGGFFSAYNQYLIDTSLDDLKMALSNIQKGQITDVDRLLSYAVSEELNKPTPDTYDVLALQYSKDVMSKKEENRSWGDVETIVQDVISSKESKRGKILSFIDYLNNGIKGALGMGKKVKTRIEEKRGERITNIDQSDEKNKVMRTYYKAVKLREEGKYAEAAKIYETIADEYQSLNIAPLLLFQAASTYMNDCKDESRASELMNKIKKQYPTTMYSYKKMQEEKPWARAMPVKMVRNAISAGSTAFAQIMVYKTIEQLERRREKKDDLVTIDPTDEQITKATQEFVNQLLENTPFIVEDCAITFAQDNTVIIRGTGKIGAINVAGEISGKVFLVKEDPGIGFVSRNSILENKAAGESWAVYNVKKAKIGPFEISSDFVNKCLEESHKVFNKKLPIKLQGIEVKPEIGASIWTGTYKGSGETPKYELLLKVKEEKEQ